MDARANATLNNQGNITTLEGTLERLLGQLHYRRERIDLALVDPPRAGCHPKALQALQALRVEWAVVDAAASTAAPATPVQPPALPPA